MPTKTYTPALINNARSLRQTMPPAERRLWFDGLPSLQQKFRRQRPVGRYIVDFYCAAAQLVVELDGASHDHDKAQTYDTQRTAYLAGIGMRVIRFTNDEVMRNLEGVMFDIARVMQDQLHAAKPQPLRPSGTSLPPVDPSALRAPPLRCRGGKHHGSLPYNVGEMSAQPTEGSPSQLTSPNHAPRLRRTLLPQ